MLQVAQRQHRGQHGVRERGRPCWTRSTRPSSTARCPRSPKAFAARASGSVRPPPTPIRFCSQLNPRSETIRADWQALKGFNDTYSGAAQDILTTLNAASTTSATITSHAKQLDALLLATIGLSNSGISLLAPNQANLIKAINVLEPTTNLLYKYNPEYTCLLVGAKTLLDTGGYEAPGGNGRSLVLDAGLALGDDPYHYPDNLPVVGAKGGPGGKPSCGSLPIVDKNWPVRQLITNTGFGTGVDWRPNPGIGFPAYANYLPVTRAVPEPPSIRNLFGGPAPGPIPYPGAPGLRCATCTRRTARRCGRACRPRRRRWRRGIPVRRRVPNRSSSRRPRRCSRRRCRPIPLPRRPRRRRDHPDRPTPPTNER